MRIEIVEIGDGRAWIVYAKDRRGRVMFSSGMLGNLRAARRHAEFLALPLEGEIKVIRDRPPAP